MSLTEEAPDGDDFREISETNFQRIHNKITKVGYADGVAQGREIAFQSGFDLGYSDGIYTGFELQKYKAFFQQLTNNKCQDRNLLREKNVFDGMQVPEVKNVDHFQYRKHKDEILETISEEQQQYVKELLAKCKRDLPLTSELLIKL